MPEEKRKFSPCLWLLGSTSLRGVSRKRIGRNTFMTNDAIKSAGEHLARGWARYVAAFGIAPLGTAKQMAALLELSKGREWVKDAGKAHPQKEKAAK